MTETLTFEPMQTDTANTVFDLAFDVVNNTACNLFLTGKAGTGKTTFLKYVQQNSRKQCVTTAPTGVAAINAGGVTLHSFFQLPFIPYIPSDEFLFQQVAATNRYDLLKKIRFNRDKIALLNDLELLIIDEVSMLRADMMDAINDILQHFRNNHNDPFGGVQVLLIGDLFQLPPVVSDDEWRLLRNTYETPFFFSAKVIEEHPPLFIELKKIYRQSEQNFITLLNNIRNNNVDEWDMQILEDRFQPDLQEKAENTIILTTHNYKADQVNQQELNKIDGEMKTFTAEIRGEFSDKAYPTEEKLLLKTGAQVMFIRNDPEPEKRYFNGKIATVKAIQDGKIVLEPDGGGPDIQLEREKWKNIRYNLNKETNRIEEDEIGSFSQFPLRLAWAITIHKSQGLTFDSAIIDAGQSFAAGQVYVALSRCRTLDGVTLLSRIHPQSIKSDERIIDFSRRENSADEIEELLRAEKRNYAAVVLVKTFNWNKLVNEIEGFNETTRAKNLPDKEKLQEMSGRMLLKAKEQQGVAGKFAAQLKHILSQKPIDENLLNERVTKAKQYFAGILHEEIGKTVAEIHAMMKTKSRVKQYLEQLSDLEKMVWAKIRDIEKLTFGDMQFEVSAIQRTEPVITVERGKKVEKGESQRVSLELYKQGKTIDEIAEERGMVYGTIETHLAQFVSSGEVNIYDLVNEELLAEIKEALQQVPDDKLNPLKDILGDKATYGQLRIAVNYLKGKN